MYKQILDIDGSTNKKIIKRLSDNASIPFDPANTDFIEYQKWLELGNTPLPAENE
jgi:hypothetical protein